MSASGEERPPAPPARRGSCTVAASGPPAARPRATAAAAVAATVLLLAAIALGWHLRSAADAGAAALASATTTGTPWWASKRSLLNVYVAKIAWGWTTAMFAAALWLCAPARPARETAAALARYALATAYWVAMARWFFGPPLFDRVFVHTGGSCLADPPRSPAALGLPVATLQACKQAGGSWSGGHDVSGHCFLLIHSTLFLVDEVLAPLRAAGRRSASPAAAQRAVLAAALGLVAVWVFMLFVTARYFHGAPELLSGIAAGAGGWVAQRAATASLLS